MQWPGFSQKSQVTFGPHLHDFMVNHSVPFMDSTVSVVAFGRVITQCLWFVSSTWKASCSVDLLRVLSKRMDDVKFHILLVRLRSFPYTLLHLVFVD